MKSKGLYKTVPYFFSFLCSMGLELYDAFFDANLHRIRAVMST